MLAKRDCLKGLFAHGTSQLAFATHEQPASGLRAAYEQPASSLRVAYQPTVRTADQTTFRAFMSFPADRPSSARPPFEQLFRLPSSRTSIFGTPRSLASFHSSQRTTPDLDSWRISLPGTRKPASQQLARPPTACKAARVQNASTWELRRDRELPLPRLENDTVSKQTPLQSQHWNTLLSREKSVAVAIPHEPHCFLS